MRIVRIVPPFILAIVVMITIPAVASATHGRSGTVVKKEQITTVYTTHYSSNHDRGRSHYRHSANTHYRHPSSKHVRQPPRHAPAHGYHKKRSHPAPDKQYRHRSPQTRGHIAVQAPTIIVRIGF